MKLKQGSGAALVYALEFVRLAKIAKIKEETLEKMLFYSSLSQDIQGDLVHHIDAHHKKFEEFVNLCIQIDSMQHGFCQLQKGTHHIINQPTTSPCTIFIPRTPATPTISAPSAPLWDSNAMKIDAQGQLRITPAERAKRMAEEHCLHCGQFGHMARDCS